MRRNPSTMLRLTVTAFLLSAACLAATGVAEAPDPGLCPSGFFVVWGKPTYICCKWSADGKLVCFSPITGWTPEVPVPAPASRPADGLVAALPRACAADPPVLGAGACVGH